MPNITGGTSQGGSCLKVETIKDCYSQLRISGLTVTPTPEELEAALWRLENMAAEWFARNICAGYNFEDEPDPNSELGVNRAYWQAFATNLAVRLIPDFNKDVPPTLMAQASQSLSALSGASAINRLNQVDYPNRMARGSGNTLRYNRWNRFYRKNPPAPNSSFTNELIVGDINDYVEHFDPYLKEISPTYEEIESYDIITSPALRLISDENASPDINYRIEASDSTSTQGLDNQQVTIIIKTTTGRVETRYIYFSITPRMERYGL